MSDPERPPGRLVAGSADGTPGAGGVDGTTPDPPAVEVAIQNPSRYSGSRDLSIWLTQVLREIAPEKAAVGLLLTDDDQMADLNRRYRQKEETTDVLSFPGDEGSSYLGDIVISVPYATEQAAAHGHDLDREMRILLLHGALHCLGHDHESDEGEMRRYEARLQRTWIDER